MITTINTINFDHHDDLVAAMHECVKNDVTLSGEEKMVKDAYIDTLANEEWKLIECYGERQLGRGYQAAQLEREAVIARGVRRGMIIAWSYMTDKAFPYYYDESEFIVACRETRCKVQSAAIISAE